MKLKVSNAILIEDIDINERRTLTKYFSILNPVYAVMKRQGNMRALYAIKEYITYYKNHITGLIVGRGSIDYLLKNFKESINGNILVSFSAKTVDTPIKKKVVLRKYQEGIVEKILEHQQGIIKLSTGYGKSMVALKLTEETQLKTLIVVPRLNLLKQFQADIKNLYGLECGIINGQTFDVKEITIATIQTLKLRDLSKIKSEFGMIIFDECHLYISDKSIRVIMSFNPLRLYGMSGTPDRSDGQGEALKFYFGDIIVDKALPQEKPTVKIYKYDGKYFGSTYSEIIDLQSQDENRNKLIADIANKEIYDGRKIIILTKRVDHYQRIAELITSDKAFPIRATLPSTEGREQQRLLERLREGSGDFNAILGTFSLLSTGINIPALDTIIFAGDIKSNVLATQSIGRILRLFEGKKKPKIIDIDDCKSGILANQARLRRKFYKENNWEIL
jgi:superfamily II DNA or RNA helicase